MASVHDIEFFILDVVGAGIGRNKIDIESSENFPLALTFTIKDVRDIANSKGDYSKTMQIPATKHNNRVFRQVYSDAFMTTNLDITGMKDCAIYVSGTEILRGSCRITSSSRRENPEYYEVQVFSSNSDWTSRLASMYMCELNFEAGGGNMFPLNTQDVSAQPYTKEGIEATWNIQDSDYGYMVYPLVNTGQWIYDSGNGVEVENFFPAFFIRNLVKLVFAQIGYTVESNFMDTDWFKKQLVYFGRQEFSLTTATTTAFSTSVTSTGDSNWSRPQLMCMKQNARYSSPQTLNCNYFLGGLPFDNIVTDPAGAFNTTANSITPDFNIWPLQTYIGNAQFLGWKWWGRHGYDRIVGGDDGPDNDGKDFGWIRCEDEMPGWAGTTLESSGWKFRYYPFSSEKCIWPEPVKLDGTLASGGLSTSDLEQQWPNWNPGVTQNSGGYWNWYALNFCNIGMWTCQQHGLYYFKGVTLLELNIHSIWRWNRGFTAQEERTLGNDWEYTVPCWQPSLYWRSGLLPQDNHHNIGGGENFVRFPNWKLEVFGGALNHARQMEGGNNSMYDRDFMYTGAGEDTNANDYNPSFMRCGDKPECYVAGSDIVGSSSSGDYILSTIHYAFNPYSPWNFEISSPNEFESYVLADWDASGTSWYTWGKNMCPMVANNWVSDQDYTTGSWTGSHTGPYYAYHYDGQGLYSDVAGAMVVPCYWGFKRNYITFTANVFLCIRRLNTSGSPMTNWDGREFYDVMMVGRTDQHNSRQGWCMCSDELCNGKSPYWNPMDVGSTTSTWNTSSNTHGCAIDCFWGDIDIDGGPDWSQECYTNPWATTASTMNNRWATREGYRAMKTPPNSTTGNRASGSLFDDPHLGKFCCDGSGDAANVLNVIPTGQNWRQVVCQPFMEDGTKTTWDNIIPYEDWDNTENMPDLSTAGSTGDTLCRQPLEKGIHHRLYANYSQYNNGVDPLRSEDPTGYYNGGGINFSVSWGQADDIMLEILPGESAFLYTEVVEQLWAYGSAPDSAGSVVGYNNRGTNWYSWAIDFPDITTWDGTNGWNTAGGTTSMGLNMFSWCCHEEWDEMKPVPASSTPPRGWWGGPAHECYGTASGCGDGDWNLAVDYCGEDHDLDTAYQEIYGCTTEPGSNSMQNNTGRNWQVSGHNMWWGMMTMSKGKTASVSDGQGGGIGINVWGRGPELVEFKKTSFRHSAGSQWAIELSDAILVGTSFPITDVLPCAESMLDFINGLTGLYNLYWDANAAQKSIKVEPYADFYSAPNNAVSWKNKLDTSQNIKNVFSTDFLKRNLCFTYQEDSSDKLAVETHKMLDSPACHYDSFFRQLSDEYVNEDQKLGTKYYAPTVMAYDMTIGNPDTPGFVPFIPFINKEYTDLVNVTLLGDLPERMEKWTTRTFQWGGLQPMNRFDGNDPSNTWLCMGDMREDYPFAGTYDDQKGTSGNYTFGSLTTGGRTFFPTLAYHNDVCQFEGDSALWPNMAGTLCSGLYLMFYSQQIETLMARPKLKEAYFKLNAVDIQGLEFSRLIHLDLGETDTYWTLNRIIDYQPHTAGMTKVELLEYVNYTTLKAQQNNGGDTSTPNKSLYNQVVGYLYNRKAGKFYNFNKNNKINTLSTVPQDVPIIQAGGHNRAYDLTKKRMKGTGPRGEKNQIIGSGFVETNKGGKIVGKELTVKRQGQVKMGEGKNKMISKSTSDFIVESGGKNIVSVRDGQLTSGYGDMILVLNPTTGAYDNMYQFDYDKRTGKELVGVKRKLSPVYGKKGKDLYT